MEVDLSTATTYTQTRLIDLTTPWKSCAFATPTLNPSPSWISSIYNSATKMLTINVSSTDLSLKDTSVIINIILIAAMKNSYNNLPLNPWLHLYCHIQVHSDTAYIHGSDPRHKIRLRLRVPRNERFCSLPVTFVRLYLCVQLHILANFRFELHHFWSFKLKIRNQYFK